MSNYEFFYEGSVTPLDPIYSDTPEYQVPFSDIGTHVDARTANQIKEVTAHLNTGIKNIEVQGTMPEIMDSIPQEQFKEMNRVAKLTGAELSMHAPMIDPAGLSQNGWQKVNQEAAERQLWDAVKRSHDLNPEGNINVTMHATTAGLPPAELKIKENGKEVIKSVLLVDPNGNLGQIREEERYFPTEAGEIQGKIEFNPEKEIERKNKEAWLQQVNNLNFYAQRGEEMIESMNVLAEKSKVKDFDLSKMGEKAWAELKTKHPEAGALKEIDRRISHGSIYLRDAYQNLKKNFDLIYKNADQDDRDKLDAYRRKIAPQINDFENLEENPQKLNEFSVMIEEGVRTLGNIKQPRIFTPLKEFAIEKVSETFSNLALRAYKEFGKTAPVISIENHPAGMSVLTRAEDIRKVIIKSREEFVKKARESGYSGGDAKAMAEKLIGATWDVGHINQLRRYGYDKSDMIKEAGKIAPYVKHVHLSDNFGFENVELPMGMGNVPMKEIRDKFKKAGFKGKEVIEAAAWWQHFSPGGKQNPPLVPTMQAFGSPIYPMQMQPAWNQVYGSTGAYFAGYGTISPEIHHSLYGAGFASLPTELGGQIPGRESRQTGTPMS